LGEGGGGGVASIPAPLYVRGLKEFDSRDFI